jgi:hypothetical protein
LITEIENKLREFCSKLIENFRWLKKLLKYLEVEQINIDKLLVLCRFANSIGVIPIFAQNQ